MNPSINQDARTEKITTPNDTPKSNYVFQSQEIHLKSFENESIQNSKESSKPKDASTTDADSSI